MTTIGGNNQRIKEKKMNNNQEYEYFIVYRGYLADYIKPIEDEIGKVIRHLQGVAISYGRIPYSLQFNDYHTPMLTRVMNSALMQLNKDKSNISMKAWSDYLEIYLNTPKKDIRTSGDSTSTMTPFFHTAPEGELSMFELIDSIGNYMLTFQDELKIPYLQKSGKFSPRVISHFALIHTGKMLLESSNDEQSG